MSLIWPNYHEIELWKINYDVISLTLLGKSCWKFCETWKVHGKRYVLLQAKIWLLCTVPSWNDQVH